MQRRTEANIPLKSCIKKRYQSLEIVFKRLEDAHTLGGSLGNCLIKIGCRINKTFKKTYENDKTLDHQLLSSLGESLGPLA